jgi:hypothetical protein
MFDLHFTEISRVVQQVLAPAFLLAGIGTFLMMMTQRLARIIDRAREVAFETDSPDESDDLAALRDQLAIRARLIQRAIVFCTLTAIVVCGLIAVMFVDALLVVSLTRLIAVTFALAMCTLMTGLVFFVREVFVATASLRSRHIRRGGLKVRNAV